MTATAIDLARALANDERHQRRRRAPWTGPTAAEEEALDRRLRADDLRRLTPWTRVPNGRPREVVCEARNLETGKLEAVFLCVGSGR